ncbi:hypothetical protein ACFU6K_15305 [Kitasatospora sp. NPDC057512]|uniref:hypothetical protein n=1 Tax=Kitasatospora sp. NPDC057512 TaxID=3346154 RepID=UPI003680C484
MRLAKIRAATVALTPTLKAKRLSAATAAAVLLVLPAAGAAHAAPGEKTAHSGRYHVVGAVQEISPEAAEGLRSGAEQQGLASSWVTPWAHWTPYAGGEVNDVRMHVFSGSDGHDRAYAEAYLNYAWDGLYLDVSQTAGNGHWPWQAQNLSTVGGQSHRETASVYDGPGNWVRACGASWGDDNDPWGNPRWGTNIACTAWN